VADASLFQNLGDEDLPSDSDEDDLDYKPTWRMILTTSRRRPRTFKSSLSQENSIVALLGACWKWTEPVATSRITHEPWSPVVNFCEARKVRRRPSVLGRGEATDLGAVGGVDLSPFSRSHTQCCCCVSMYTYYIQTHTHTHTHTRMHIYINIHTKYRIYIQTLLKTLLSVTNTHTHTHFYLYILKCRWLGMVWQHPRTPRMPGGLRELNGAHEDNKVCQALRQPFTLLTALRYPVPGGRFTACIVFNNISAL
jgi:hypothetical protein